MARARNIKPSFFTNEVLGTMEPIAGLLFIGLWCLADKDGILEDRPLRIKAELFPYRDSLDINGYLTDLARTNHIVRYSVSGASYIKVLNFEKHQSPHHTEKSKGFPQPQYNNAECTLTPLFNGDLTVPTRSDSLIPDSLIPDSKPLSGKPDGVMDLHFETFWKAYPRKQAKEQAKKAWKKIRKPSETLQEIILALEWQKELDQWKRENGQFIPFPASYLNAGRWMDEKPKDEFEEWRQSIK